MERDFPIIAKKCWTSLHFIYLMLRNGVSKRTLFTLLNIFIKRSKLAGRAALHTLLFHYSRHHRRSRSSSSRIPFKFPPPPQDYKYEFCTTLVYPTILHLNKGEKIDQKLMADALEIFHSATASPALPGLGASPAVRRIRVLDSPSPFYTDEDEDADSDGSHVDEAAEKFIIKFYRELELQNQSSPAPS